MHALLRPAGDQMSKTHDAMTRRIAWAAATATAPRRLRRPANRTGAPGNGNDGIGSSNRRCQPRLLMTPALFVEFGLKPFGARGSVSSSLSLHDGHGAPAPPQVQALALERFIRVIFTDPAAIRTHCADHGLSGCCSILTNRGEFGQLFDPL
jgi:hypothetical protein